MITSYCTISITLADFLHLVWSLFEEEHTHICILQYWFWYHRYTVVFSMTEHMENRNVTFQQCPPPTRKCTVNTTSSDGSDDICRTVNGTEQVGSWHYSIYLSLPQLRKWARLVILHGHIAALQFSHAFFCWFIFLFCNERTWGEWLHIM